MEVAAALLHISLKMVSCIWVRWHYRLACASAVVYTDTGHALMLELRCLPVLVGYAWIMVSVLVMLGDTCFPNGASRMVQRNLLASSCLHG
jgi:hypothetical protein